MHELSLHILDLLQNAAEAGANRVDLTVTADTRQHLLTICVEDNGKGISEEILEKVSDPFTTTRTSRKVGLGLALLKAAAESCGGSLKISSRVNVGTKVTASFRLDHIDLPPLGDIAGTVMVFMTGRCGMIFSYRHCRDDREYVFSSLGYERLWEHPEFLIKFKETIEAGLKSLA
ncbi:MAG TPA: hypothetical protein DCQ14_02680 [Firmicutes bacterium]|nr:hypothetical protein [Bacillota bacterium]